jgi:hypothetical protein
MVAKKKANGTFRFGIEIPEYLIDVQTIIRITNTLIFVIGYFVTYLYAWSVLEHVLSFFFLQNYK